MLVQEEEACDKAGGRGRGSVYGMKDGCRSEEWKANDRVGVRKLGCLRQFF